MKMSKFISNIIQIFLKLVGIFISFHYLLTNFPTLGIITVALMVIGLCLVYTQE